MGKIPSSSSMECQKRNTYLNKQKQQQQDQQQHSSENRGQMTDKPISNRQDSPPSPDLAATTSQFPLELPPRYKTETLKHFQIYISKIGH